jgi:hypothetical protein
MMVTKEDLELENELLREENERLRAELDTASEARYKRDVPTLPSYGMSEGTANDIRAARDRIDADDKLREVTVVEPFAGKSLTVTADDVREADENPDASITTSSVDTGK